MRYLSVFLPRLPTDRILRQRNSGLGARAPDAAASSAAPFAVWTKIKGGDYLAAVDARAERLGLVPGMAVADARAMHPSLLLEEADLLAEAELLASIADWCRRFTPLAAIDPPDGVILDVTGASHLFGGEAAMLDEVERLLSAQGFAVRVALAPGPALARALVRFSPVRRAPPESSPEDIAKIAARLPIAALGLAEAARSSLARAGLRHVGDLLSRPRAPFAARFGPETNARVDALLCRARDPISPRFEAPDYMAERRFANGIARLEDIEATLAALSRDLCVLLERHGVGARRLAAAFYRVDGAVRHIEAGTSRPLRDPALFASLLRERLAVLDGDGLDTGYGFDTLRLCAMEVERCETPQTTLGPAHDPSAVPSTAGEAPDLADLVDRLGARLGLRRVLRLYPQDAHIPEFAVAAIPAAYAPTGPSSRRSCEPEGSRSGSRWTASLQARKSIGESLAPARPLRLFERPEPIDAVALTPDGPPLRFRWRRALHEVAAYEGPERIAPQWWTVSEAALTRDYFCAEDREGRRFWLFRQGLLERECAHPRWFVHGLF